MAECACSKILSLILPRVQTRLGISRGIGKDKVTRLFCWRGFFVSGRRCGRRLWALLKLNAWEMVRSTVEEKLNELLDAEADRLCNARRYERTSERRDTRAGSYKRSLETRSGKVTLKVPKLRSLPFETAIIERYRRRESSVEEALVEMYLAGVSVRRVEDITEALWGSRVSPRVMSELNKKIYRRIDEWRNRAIKSEYPYVYLDGVYLKRSWGGEMFSSLLS